MSFVRQNIEVNNIEGVTMLEAAASDTEGTTSFWEHAHKPGGSTMMKAVYESKVKESFKEYQVPTILLSKHLPWKVDLLKMDVEGAEGSILKELAEHDALANIDRIIMEYHDNAENASNELVSILNTFKKAKFTIALYTNEFNISSERLIRSNARHFMIRADKI
jgi:FkbM family methyltransferase